MALAAAVAGCGKIQQAGVNVRTPHDLHALGLAYHEYAQAKGGAGPASAEELQPYCKNSTAEFAKLKAGNYVLIWGVRILEGGAPAPGLANVVLGYEAQVPQVGGRVLLGDASIRAMNVQQFQSTPKATPAKKS